VATACIAQVAFRFEPKGEPVVDAFDMPESSSDGGAILLTSVDTGHHDTWGYPARLGRAVCCGACGTNCAPRLRVGQLTTPGN